MLRRVITFHVDGLRPRRVTVEADLRPGLPAFTVVGLGDRAVRESRERVRAAVQNAGFDFPAARLTINLAPAALEKHGPGFDLAIATAVLAVTGQVPADLLDRVAVHGELSLGGEVRPVRGVLAVAEGCDECGVPALAVPAENAAEAALVEGLGVHPVRSLRELAGVLGADVGEAAVSATAPPLPTSIEVPTARLPDLEDVRGHAGVIEALVVAAAGGHNVLLSGPPGTGKTMLARRLPSILPPMTRREAVEVTRIASVAGLPTAGLARERPFRAPHHTASAPALVGGGATPRPGEVTLAHRGVLFLDELPEFPRHVLDALRQPLEDGRVVVVRGQTSALFPARFMLLAAMNPCPCGHRGDADRCRCDDSDLARHRRRLSGPLLDRFDLLLAVPRPSREELGSPAHTTSAAARARVVAARERQEARRARTGAVCNAELDARAVRACVRLDSAAEAPVRRAYEHGAISPRGEQRLLRLARTLADLDDRDDVTRDDVLAALALRPAAAEERVA